MNTSPDPKSTEGGFAAAAPGAAKPKEGGSAAARGAADSKKGGSAAARGAADSKKGGSAGTPARLSLWLAVAVVIVAAVVSLRVGPWHDLGFLFDDYARLRHGLTPHVDYLTAIPQLSTVLTYLAYPDADDIFFYFALNGAAVWLTGVALMYVLAKKLDLPTEAVALCLLLCAVAGDPFTTTLDYNAYGAAVLVTVVILSLRILERAGPLTAFFLGCAVAGAIFIKPPFGVAALAVCGTAFLLCLLSGARRPVLLAVDALAGAAGGALVAALSLLVLMRGHVSYLTDPTILSESLRQMFLDAGAAKGGRLKVALHWIPRFKIENVWQALWQQAVGGMVPYLLAFAGLARWAQAKPTNDAAGLGRVQVLVAIAAALSVAIILLAALTVLPFMQKIDGRSVPAMQVWNNLFYLFALSVVLVLLWRHARESGFAAMAATAQRRRTLLAAVAVIAAIFAVGASSIDYLPFSGAALFPVLAFVLIALLGRVRAARVLTVCLLIFLVMANTVAGYRNNGFRANCPLPTRAGGVSHLAAAAEPCARFAAFAADIGPRLTGKRVVWLTTPYGLADFWGVPARGLGLLFWDGFAPRAEPLARAVWTKDPPDIFVVERGAAFPKNSSFLDGGEGRRWIEARYRVVPTRPGPFTVFEKR